MGAARSTSLVWDCLCPGALAAFAIRHLHSRAYGLRP